MIEFPGTPIIDDCNRADQGSPPGTNWTTWFNDGFGISGNQIAPNNTLYAGAYWSAQSFGANAEFYFDVPVALAASGALLLFRLDIATDTGYQVEIGQGLHIAIIRRNGGAGQTNLAVGPPYTLSNNDGLGIRVNGNLIQAWVKKNGIWRVELQVTDTTYPGSPTDNVGMWTNGNFSSQLRLDNVGGGTVPTTSFIRPIRVNI